MRAWLQLAGLAILLIVIVINAVHRANVSEEDERDAQTRCPYGSEGGTCS